MIQNAFLLRVEKAIAHDRHSVMDVLVLMAAVSDRFTLLVITRSGLMHRNDRVGAIHELPLPDRVV